MCLAPAEEAMTFICAALTGLPEDSLSRRRQDAVAGPLRRAREPGCSD
jgi:hypothetical protein